MELAVETRGLVKRFGDVVAVGGIDLRVPRGRCVGFLGPNGAGKTTTLEILEGLQSPTSGEVRILGRSWRDEPDEIRARIGVQLQSTAFYDRLTVQETITLFRSFYARGLGVDEVLGQVGLREKRNAQLRNLSGGQRQRVALAVALVSEPELLFLDEPTTGLDPQSRRALWDVIEGLKVGNRTVVLTTHYLEEAEALCDEIIIIDGGRVVAEGTPAALIAGLGEGQVVEFSAEAGPAEALVARLPHVREVRRRGETMVLQVDDAQLALAALLRASAEEGLRLHHLHTRRPSLDDVFLHITGRALRAEQGTDAP